MTSKFVFSFPADGPPGACVEIEICGRSHINGRPSLNSASAYVRLTAEALGVGTWPMLDHNSERPWRVEPYREMTEGELIDHAKKFEPEAIRALQRLPEIYAELPAMLGALNRADVSTRQAYEQVCQQLGATPEADDAVSTWGEFTFPEYAGTLDAPFAKLATRILAQRRAFVLEREMKATIDPGDEAAVPQRAADLNEVRGRPVHHVYQAVLPGQRVVGEETFDGGELQTIAKVLGTLTIDDNMPSIDGVHLFGFEGEPGSRVEIAIRSLEPPDPARFLSIPNNVGRWLAAGNVETSVVVLDADEGPSP